MKSLTIILFICILLIGCSTPYQPKGVLGGYSSTKLDEETFRVEFKGNQHTKAHTVFEYLVRRCAEITVENGYEYFIVYADSSYLDDTVMKAEGADLDEQLDVFQNPMRVDTYLLDRKPVITRDPIEIILGDHHSKIGRTYSYTFIDSEATNVVGVYTILFANRIIGNFKDYYHPAIEILEKYNQ